MNIEDKQKAMLSDDLSAYVKDKRTQEECIGFIDGYNAALTKLKLLGIGDVSQQSELVCTSYYPNNRSTGMECLTCGKGKHEH